MLFLASRPPYLRNLEIAQQEQDHETARTESPQRPPGLHLKSKPCSGNPIIPFLLLKGTWLEQAGFTIDTPVSVTVEDGQLSIVRERLQ